MDGSLNCFPFTNPTAQHDEAGPVSRLLASYTPMLPGVPQPFLCSVVVTVQPAVSLKLGHTFEGLTQTPWMAMYIL